MKKILLFCMGLCLSFSAFSQVVSVKGIGTVTYDGFSVNTEEKQAAIRSAKMSAVERYFAENGEMATQNLETIAPQLEANLDKFILSDIVVDELYDKSRRRYTIALKVEINVPKLRIEIKKATSNAGGATKATASSKTQLAYLFIARQVASSQAFDDRVVQRADTSYNASVNATDRGSRRSGSRSASVSMQDSTKVETGGSVTRKADNVSYRLLPMDDKKTAISKAFSNAGYKVADSAMVLDDKETQLVNADYSNGNDLKPSTIKMVANRMRLSGVSYLVIATLDIGAPMEDAATGQRRANVSVSGRVLDLTSGIPSETAAVTPQQISGLGPDNGTAAAVALKKASELAAQELVSTLQASGIQ